jgi:hypothetical protein
MKRIWTRTAAAAFEKKLQLSIKAGTEGKKWIGVDLDGTLAEYDEFEGPDVIGKPIPEMLERVKGWLDEGKEVRIMTARVSPDTPDHDIARKAIRAYLDEHLPGYDVPVTHEKDFLMEELWDDRAVQVKPNTGERVDGKD